MKRSNSGKFVAAILLASANPAHAEDKTVPSGLTALQASSAPASAAIKRYGIVPVRSGLVPDVTPVCNSPKVSYFGGPLVSNAQVIPVFWNSAVNAEVKANMPQFYADAAISPWFDLLSEYATTGTTPNQSIGRGTSTAGVTLVPSRCATSSATATSTSR